MSDTKEEEMQPLSKQDLMRANELDFDRGEGATLYTITFKDGDLVSVEDARNARLEREAQEREAAVERMEQSMRPLGRLKRLALAPLHVIHDITRVIRGKR